MGIGINFVCKCCHYDSGLLMLNQGIHDPVETVIRKYIHSYTKEIDLDMLSHRVKQYERILDYIKDWPPDEITYNYYACVCYGCRRTYEMLDILQRKEEQVLAGEIGGEKPLANPIHEMFFLSESIWSSLLGEPPSCVFCNQPVVKITEQKLSDGLHCPKCAIGKLVIGEEFEVWE